MQFLRTGKQIWTARIEMAATHTRLKISIPSEETRCPGALLALRASHSLQAFHHIPCNPQGIILSQHPIASRPRPPSILDHPPASHPAIHVVRPTLTVSLASSLVFVAPAGDGKQRKFNGKGT